jgi:tRNA nucleotidyltransferase (CCA-adding enzyme)
MAMGLNKDNYGCLIDFYGGQKDIKEKKIRVLHNLSFVEDPTRIFRAVKFEQRYNFKIDNQTEHLIKTAVDMDMFLRVAGERIREELIPILSEKTPLKGILRMQQLHELRFIHPKIKLTPALKKVLGQIEKNLSRYQQISRQPLKGWLVYLICLLSRLSRKDIKVVTSRLVLSNTDTDILLWCNLNSDKIISNFKKNTSMLPSQIYKIFRGAKPEALLALMSMANNKRIISAIEDYIETYSQISLKISGKDIKKMGLKPSPNYGRIMNKLLYLKLDKGFSSRKDELDALASIISKNKV